MGCSKNKNTYTLGYSNVPTSEGPSGTVYPPERTITCSSGKPGVLCQAWPSGCQGKVLGRGTVVNRACVVLEPVRTIVEDPLLTFRQPRRATFYCDVKEPKTSSVVASCKSENWKKTMADWSQNACSILMYWWPLASGLLTLKHRLDTLEEARGLDNMAIDLIVVMSNCNQR